MIVVPADAARAVRAAVRRLSPGRSAHPPPVEVVAGPDGLLLRVATADAAVEYRHPGPCEPGRLVVPADTLAVGDRPGRSPLRLVGSPAGVEVRWSDRGREQEQSFPIPKEPGPFPDLDAGGWADNPPGLAAALADAAAVAAKESGRYAAHRVQLRGSRGEVVATDTHQLLLQGGFAFPWDGDLLVARAGAGLLGTLGVAGPVRVGRTAIRAVEKLDYSGGNEFSTWQPGEPQWTAGQGATADDPGADRPAVRDHQGAGAADRLDPLTTRR